MIDSKRHCEGCNKPDEKGRLMHAIYTAILPGTPLTSFYCIYCRCFVEIVDVVEAIKAHEAALRERRYE